MPGAARALSCPACFLPSQPGAGAASVPTQGCRGNLALGRVGSTMAPQCQGRIPHPKHPGPCGSAPSSARGLGRRSLLVEACLRSSPVCSGQVPDPGRAWAHGARGCQQRRPHPWGGAGSSGARGWAPPLPRRHGASATRAGKDGDCARCPRRGASGPALPCPCSQGAASAGGALGPLCPPATRWARGAAWAVHCLLRPVLHPWRLGGTLACRRSTCCSPPGVRVPLPAPVPAPQLGTRGSCQPGAAQPTPGGTRLSLGQAGLDPITHLASGSGLLSPGAARG